MNLTSFIFSINQIPVPQAKEELKKIQSLSKDDFIAWQQNKAWEIARFHYDNNAFYKAKVGKHFPHTWVDLPIITKQDLQQPLEILISKGIKLHDCYRSGTSGSSGTPFLFAKDKYAHAMTWAVIADRYSWHQLQANDKQARFYGIPKELKGYWKEKLKDGVMNRTRFSVFDLSDEVLEQYLKLFSKHKFKYLYGYTSALAVFARYLFGKGIVLSETCPSLQLCISTSELSTPYHDSLFKTAFGVKHIREYGVSETCMTGFDGTSGDMILTEETLYNEVVNEHWGDAGYGAQGTLLSTSLFNRALPMVRYHVGDELVLRQALTSTSIYRTITELNGRTNDIIQLPGGKRAAGLSLYYVAGSIAESLGIIKEFIVRQTALDTFVFDIVAARKLSTEELYLLKNKVELYLDKGLEVEIQYVDKVERPASGKRKLFYSELN